MIRCTGKDKVEKYRESSHQHESTVLNNNLISRHIRNKRNDKIHARRTHRQTHTSLSFSLYHTHTHLTPPVLCSQRSCLIALPMRMMLSLFLFIFFSQCITPPRIASSSSSPCSSLVPRPSSPLCDASVKALSSVSLPINAQHCILSRSLCSPYPSLPRSQILLSVSALSALLHCSHSLQLSTALSMWLGSKEGEEGGGANARVELWRMSRKPGGRGESASRCCRHCSPLAKGNQQQRNIWSCISDLTHV